MKIYPAVIVHGLADAVAALARGHAERNGVTLLSAPGAASYAGCGWWRALVEAARASHPDVPCIDILDCADATGQALAALRIGLFRLVLWPDAPGRDAVVAIAEAMGGFVLPAAPPVNQPVITARVSRGTAATFPASPAEPGRHAANPEPADPCSANGDKRPPPG